MRKLKIAFCGGGTGGHYYPAVALLQEIGKRTDFDLLYFTVKGKIDDRSVERDFPGVSKVPLELRGLLRPLYSPGNIPILFSHMMAKKQVLRSLMDFRPDFLFSTGGYISFPVIKAAHELKIPIFIHEQNSIAGITNKRMAKYAEYFFISFEETAGEVKLPAERIVLSGNPVRESTKSREELLKGFGLSSELPFVVVLGGSLGSSVINDACEKLYDLLEESNMFMNFLHSTGDEEKAKDLLRFPFVRSFAYIENLSDAIAVSDLVISRAGATTIAELQYHGRKGIIIPWPGAAENHQLHNAISLERLGLGYVILESDLTPEKLFVAMQEMLVKDIGYMPPRRPVDIILDYILREESI